MDIDWGDIPNEKEEHEKILADCERDVKNEP